MEHFSSGWDAIRDQLLGWILFSVVFTVVISVTFGLGIFLVPNAMRCVRDAIDSGGAPDIGGLFSFDQIAEDLVGMLISLGANLLGSTLAGVGAIITGVLFFWIPPLLADGRVSGAESWKASLAHSKEHFVDILVFTLVASAINFVGAMLCGLGLLITVPVTLAASWLFYAEQRDQILELAQRDGVGLLPG